MKLLYALVSAGLAIILSLVVMGILIGESCNFSPGMLVVAIFGPALFQSPYGALAGLAMVLGGAIGGKRGVYINGAVVLLGLAVFAFLAIASAHGYVPWPSRCTIDF